MLPCYPGFSASGLPPHRPPRTPALPLSPPPGSLLGSHALSIKDPLAGCHFVQLCNASFFQFFCNLFALVGSTWKTMFSYEGVILVFPFCAMLHHFKNKRNRESCFLVQYLTTINKKKGHWKARWLGTGVDWERFDSNTNNNYKQIQNYKQ